MKNKKIIYSGIGIAFLLVLFLIFFCYSGRTSPVEKMTLERISFQGVPSSKMFIRSTFLKDSSKYRFSNIAVDFDGDTKIDENEWIIKNYPVQANQKTAIRYTFDYPNQDFDDKKAIKASVILSYDTIKAWDNKQSKTVKKDLVIDQVGFSEMGSAFYPDKKGQKETGFIPSVDAQTGDTIIYDDSYTDTKINIWGVTDKYYDVDLSDIETIEIDADSDVDFSTEEVTQEAQPERMSAKIDDMPDTDQKYNECAPTAVSNSFRWLAKKYNFNDRIPQDDTDLINELKGYMEWDFGVGAGKTLEGKKNFIKERQLPLEAHLISGEGDKDVFKKIYDELKKGQAVELSLQFYKKLDSGKYEKDGAHLVTVSGLDDFTATSGNKWITISDPGTHEDDGKQGRDIYRMNGDELIEYWSGGLTKIRYAVAQSPIFDDEGNLIDFGDNKEYIVGTNGLLLPDQTLTRGMGKLGFFNVDFSGIGDHFVGDKFKTTVVITNTQRENTVRWLGEKYNVKMIGPWSLKGTYETSQNITPNKLENRPPGIQINEKRYRIETDFTCSEAGDAYVEFSADLKWMMSGEGEAPLEILKELGEELVPSDTIKVRSPTFKCLANSEENKTQIDDTVQEEDKISLNDNTFCEGYEENPDGQEVQVINIGGKCYPKFQFLLCQENHNGCETDHYHGATSDTIYALDGSKLEMNSNSNCYFGKVVNFKEGTIKLSPDQVAPFIAESVFEN